MTKEKQLVRSVAGIINSVETLEGEGFLVHRPFPTYALSEFDPFLLLDEMGPKDLGPGEAKGAPDHPHRGFETVTYMLHGNMQHKDSRGNAGALTPGDVQWMTAGSGVVHSEMPEKEFARSGGRLHGFQLWVNLPRRDKMIAPRYQEIPAERIPIATSEDGLSTVRVIAGESLGVRAVIETRTPIMYLHFTIQPGGSVTQKLPSEYNAFAYVVGGQASFGEETATRGQMVMFERDANQVLLENNGNSTLDALLIAGVPLGEPVVRYGPFVMNTKEEIVQAFEDYRTGRMGAIT
ncbi:MAG: pirin family protein [Blastocatellia bacterium]|nr:MAG: pirin family protein [Blastocatellia bacterium]